jgi:hypothetical protein
LKKDKFTKNIAQIEAIAKSHHFYSSIELRTLFKTIKEDKKLITLSYSFDSFYKRLIDMGLKEFTISMGSEYLTKYSFEKELDVYELACSFKKNSFFSMSTSLNLQGYSNYRNNFIFVSSELSEKIKDNDIELTQEAIDKAFAKPYRRTHSVGKYQDKNIVFLSPKYTKKYAVIEKQWSMSSINRAFVEMIINVQYFRNSLELIDTFIPLKKKIDIDEVFDIVNEFDLIYPYFQCVGYYLQQIGFTKNELIEFKSEVSELKFYTDKNQDKYKYDDYWNMYYISKSE